MAKEDTGTKTEKPTPKRRRDARKEGQVARSVDLVQWVALLVGSFVLPATVGTLLERLSQSTRTMLQVSARGEAGPAFGQLGEVIGMVALTLAPLFGVLFVVTAGGLAAQGGVVVAGKAIKPKWERISPKAGLKRIFSTQSLMETAKAVLRLVVFALVIWVVTVGTVRQLVGGTPTDLRAAVPVLGAGVLLMVRLAAVAGVAIGVADYFFQRHKMEKRLRMSRHDIRQEHKTAEGDPMVRSRRRSAHAKLSRNGLLAAVDDASVVVVNPTHVAVALRYADGEGAPRVVAKGGDEMARRIRERALASGVSVLEVRPLARVLFDVVNIGDHIPAELFEAVAVVLAFVMRNPERAWTSTVRRLDVAVPDAVGSTR
jgi:flagellar biosynthesis protein FlhB